MKLIYIAAIIPMGLWLISIGYDIALRDFEGVKFGMAWFVVLGCALALSVVGGR